MLKELQELQELYNKIAWRDKHVETPIRDKPQKIQSEKKKQLSRETLLFVISEHMKKDLIEKKEIESLNNRTDDELLYLYNFRQWK